MLRGEGVDPYRMGVAVKAEDDRRGIRMVQVHVLQVGEGLARVAADKEGTVEEVAAVGKEAMGSEADTAVGHRTYLVVAVKEGQDGYRLRVEEAQPAFLDR